MAFDQKYYSDRKLKLQQLEQRNIQKYLQSAFDYVETQQNIREQWNELSVKEEESKKQAGEETKKQGKNK